MKVKYLRFGAMSFFMVLAYTSCSSDSGAKKPAAAAAAEPTNDQDTTPAKKDTSGVEVSASRRGLVTSLTNNALTSRKISRRKAEDLAIKLENATQNGGNRRSLEALISAQRLAGIEFGQVLISAKHLIAIEMKKSIKENLPEQVQLELALSAISSHQLSMANYFLDKITESKTPSVRAGALTAQGMIEMLDGRVPEAMASWQDALKASPNYQAALLDIGFVSLKYGDVHRAKEALAGLDSDWFAVSGLIVAERLTGSPKDADEGCQRILAKHPEHKPTLYNCALNQYQAHQNYAEAKKLLNRMFKSKSDASAYDEKGYALVSQMENEEAEAKERMLRKKEEAAERANEEKMKQQEAAAEEKAKAEAGGQKAAKGAAGGGGQPSSSGK